MTANEVITLFSNNPTNVSLDNIDTFAEQFAALTEGLNVTNNTIAFDQTTITLGVSNGDLKLGVAGSKIGFFGETTRTQITVSNQATETPTDLETCISAITKLNTIVNSARTAIGDVTGYGLVTLG
jgi:hypothetical protein